MKVTLKVLAQELGVSKTLVSRVLNAPRHPDGTPDCDIAPETARRVLEAAKRMDYRPSRYATAFRSGKHYLLGVITPDISNYAFSETGRVIEEFAYRDGYSVMFGSSTENSTRMNELLDLFVDHGVDGIIATPCSGCREGIKKVVSRGVPVVLINRDIPDLELEGVGRVFLDNAASMEMVVRHFYDNGYRRIDMISERMDVLSLRDRENSYKETMLALGLEPHLYMVDTDYQEQQIDKYIRDAVQRGTEAIIAPRIRLSLYSLRSIMSSGLSIPEDIALFAHDESPAFSTHVPTISYVSQRSDKVGAEAYRMIQLMMSGGKAGKVLIPPDLHFGGSSAKR